MILLFSILALISMPASFICFNGLSNANKEDTSFYQFFKFTVGNLGESKPKVS